MKTTLLLLGLWGLGVAQAQYSHFDAALGLQHADITAADIDNDGDLDIVASGVVPEGTSQVSKSYIYMNNNGTYQLQGTSGAGYYQNPVFEPDVADPTVIRGGDGWFYAYGTENTWTDGVHHLVPVLRSRNLIQWQYVRDAFASRPTWKTTGGGIWAPDVTYMNGRYYMFYSISTWGDSNPGIGLAISNTPAGPFTDQGKLFDSSSIGVTNSIDPFFFQTASGDSIKSYLFWGSFNGIYGVELSSNYKTTVGEKFKIAGNAFEASYIYENDGKFYFFGSLGSCCEGVNSQYHVNVAVATSLKGPYYDKSGKTILNDGQVGSAFLSGSQSLGWVGPGHNSKIVTDDAGNNYFIYHAIDVSKPTLPGGATCRPMMMDKINWINGWPEIASGVPGKGLRVAPVINN